MTTTTKASSTSSTSTQPAQRVCIDLPGEAVKCWRSGSKIEVVKRKHRDVFLEINLSEKASYTVEATRGEFYCPRENLLLRKAEFKDGERFHIWIGREFQGELVLKANTKLLGRYTVSKLDNWSYGPDPKVKPEPLVILIGGTRKFNTNVPACTPDDPLGIGSTQQYFKSLFEPTLGVLPEYGSQFDYRHPTEEPEVQEYAAITEAQEFEIQPQVLKQLENGTAVQDSPAKIFKAPVQNQPISHLYRAFGFATTAIAGSDFLTSNFFKESAGYIQENWRQFDKLSMTVRIERKAKGKYRVLIKGKPLTKVIAKALGNAAMAKTAHNKAALGSTQSRFMDGGFSKTGKAGYGGAKRIMLTMAENFRGGMKIVVIGTVIDIIVDANTVYFDENGSRDLSEFLARAGVSVGKAGATAAIGSLFASVLFSGVVVAGGAPVLFAAGVVVLGYIAAAYLVDAIDDSLQIKNSVATWAK